MNKYDFIKFGEPVEWFDDRKDTFRKMQVCLPIRTPIKDDTKIVITPVSENGDEDERSVSYSVRADELVPLLTPFQKGYWKAVQEAAENGADDKMLLAMLKNTGFSLMEYVHLMLQGGSCKPYSVLCLLFPEIEDILQVITWKGREYPVRHLTIFRGTEDEQDILVSAVIPLQGELIDSNTYTPISDEAEVMDGDIYYYLSDDEILLPEARIITIVESA